MNNLKEFNNTIADTLYYWCEELDLDVDLDYYNSDDNLLYSISELLDDLKIKTTSDFKNYYLKFLINDEDYVTEDITNSNKDDIVNKATDVMISEDFPSKSSFSYILLNLLIDAKIYYFGYSSEMILQEYSKKELKDWYTNLYKEIDTTFKTSIEIAAKNLESEVESGWDAFCDKMKNMKIALPIRYYFIELILDNLDIEKSLKKLEIL